MNIGDFATFIYLVGFAASSICASLLVRSYLQTRTKLLLWSAICFVLLALNNAIVVLDLVVLPGTDLGLVRAVTALAGISALLYGFMWELQ